MRFLFRLDLSLHAGAGKKNWNFEFWNQTRAWSGIVIRSGSVTVLISFANVH